MRGLRSSGGSGACGLLPLRPACNVNVTHVCDWPGLRRMRGGCCASDHKVDLSEPSARDEGEPSSAEIVEMLKKRLSLVCTPFKDLQGGLASDLLGAHC